MEIVRVLSCVDGHTCGHPVRLVQGGVPRLPGQTLGEKLNHFRTHLDHLRRFLVYEPRGRANMFAAVLTEPCHPEADLAAVFMSTAGYHSGCGHGSMGVAVMAVEQGIVPRQEPVTVVKLEVPAGLVVARVQVRNGHAGSVTIRNVPSFVHTKGLSVTVPEFGRITVDIAYGGLFWIMVSMAQLTPLTIGLVNLDRFLGLGAAIKAAVAASGVQVRHPIHGDDDLDYVFFYDDDAGTRCDAQVLALYGQSQFDRSPCGSGTAARIALLHSQGRVRPGDQVTHRAMLGGVFTGTVVAEADVAGYPACVADITGTASIVGFGPGGSLPCGAGARDHWGGDCRPEARAGAPIRDCGVRFHRPWHSGCDGSGGRLSEGS